MSTGLGETPLRRRFKKYPAYKDSGVEWLGEIPAAWGLKRLKRIVEFRGGGTPTRDNLEYWRGELPWVSPKDMKVSVVLDTEDKITAQAVRESATKLVPAGAVLLVVRSGILVHSIPVALAGREVTLNQDLKALIARPVLVPVYLMYLIAGMQREFLHEWRKEGATVESLELELVANTPTPLPAIAEQRAIAAFLDQETARIDALVAKKERLIELLQEKRTTLITRVVTKGLDPNTDMKESGIEWLGEIPAHWNLRELRRLTRKGTSITYGIVQAGPDDENGVPYIRTSDMAGDSLPRAGYQRASREIDAVYQRSKVQSGDIVVAIRATVGKALPVPDYLDGANLTQGTAKVAPGDMLRSRFLLAALQSRSSQQRFEAISKGATFREITLDMLRRFVVPVPPLAEQASMMAFLEAERARIDTLVAKVRDAIDCIKELRTALISAAVTGKIDVRDA